MANIDIRRGWALTVKLSEVDDVGYVFLNGEEVCTIRFGRPYKFVDLTNILNDGDNNLTIQAHNVHPPYWRLRHEIQVRDENGQPVPHLPDRGFDVTRTGQTPHLGPQETWSYKVVVS